jgi:hypothetical protein
VGRALCAFSPSRQRPQAMYRSHSSMQQPRAAHNNPQKSLAPKPGCIFPRKCQANAVTHHGIPIAMARMRNSSDFTPVLLPKMNHFHRRLSRPSTGASGTCAVTVLIALALQDGARAPACWQHGFPAAEVERIGAPILRSTRNRRWSRKHSHGLQKKPPGTDEFQPPRRFYTVERQDRAANGSPKRRTV